LVFSLSINTSNSFTSILGAWIKTVDPESDDFVASGFDPFLISITNGYSLICSPFTFTLNSIGPGVSEVNDTSCLPLSLSVIVSGRLSGPFTFIQSPPETKSFPSLSTRTTWKLVLSFTTALLGFLR